MSARPRCTFSPEQREDLTAHLAQKLPPAALLEALANLELVCGWAAHDLNATETDRQKHDEEERERAETRAHFAAIAGVADQLGSALRCRTRLDGMKVSGGPFIPEVTHEEWEDFHGALSAIADAARHYAREPQAPARGRPRKHWRDRLIATAFTVHPEGTATKSEGSHSEETVRMLLEILGQEPEDIHGVVIESLRRMPAPPITVKVQKITPSQL